MAAKFKELPPNPAGYIWFTLTGLEGVDQLEGSYDPVKHTGYIDMLEVSESRRGYGRKAVEAMEEYLASKGVTKIYGNSVDSAAEFWEAMNYTVDDEPDEDFYYHISKKLHTAKNRSTSKKPSRVRKASPAGFGGIR